MIEAEHCAERSARHQAVAFAVLLLSIGSIIGPPAVAGDACKFVEEATLPATFNGGEVLVDVGVNGAAARFRIGTYSAFSQISRAMARRLHLPIKNESFKIATPQGSVWLDGAIVSEFKIGEKTGATATFEVMDQGGDGTTGDSAGLVGQNYLMSFDIELDPALGRVNLFLPIACPADAAYWSTEHFELPVTTDTNHRPEVHVTLDGKDFFAYLDTGAAHSLIDFAVARQRLDLPPGIDAPEPTRKVGGVQPPNPTFTFKELVFGPITIKHPKLELQRYRALFEPTGSSISRVASDEAPVIIGMDIIGKFHSMISARNGMLYFTLPNERLPAVSAAAKP